MATVLTPTETAKLEEMSQLIELIIVSMFEDSIDEGQNFDAYEDRSFGAFYDYPAPDNYYSPSGYDYHSEGRPLGVTTDFEFLRDIADATNHQLLNEPLSVFGDSIDELSAMLDMITRTAQLRELASEWLEDHGYVFESLDTEEEDESEEYSGEYYSSDSTSHSGEGEDGTGLLGGEESYAGSTAGTITAPEIDCAPPEQEEPEPPCPPPCQGDPNASNPNWTGLTENEPFLNSKTCEYSISIRTEYEAASKEDLYDSPNYLEIGVEKLLDYYGKKVESYNTEEGIEINPIQTCVDAGDIKSTFVSTRPYVKMKALVVIPYDVLNSIEDQEQPEIMPDRKEQPAFAVIKGEDFFLMTRQVARAMEIMAVRQAKWFWNEGGQLSEPTFDPKEEADRIRVFVKELRNLLLANDFRIRKPFGFAKKWLEEVEIGFDDSMAVDYVKATEKDCEKSEMMIKAFSAFKNSEPQTLARTMYFVSKLSEMQDDFTSSDSIQFDEFLRKYVAFPPVDITVEAASAYESEPIWCPPAGEDTALTTFDLSEDLRELSKSIMDEVLAYPDALADRFANDLCATLEGKNLKDIDYNDLGVLSRQAADTALREYFAGDTFLNDIPGLLDKQTDGDPSKLWADILDQLGLCGLLQLIESALNCLLAGLEIEDALKTMLNSVIGGMSQGVFEVFMLGLPKDVKDDIRANLKEEFKNMPAPWDSDFRAGSYSGQGTKYSWGTNDQSPTGVQGAEQTVETEITLEDGSTATATTTETDSEYKWYQPQKEVTYSGLPTTVGNTTGVVINESALAQSYGNSGTIGTALDKVSDQIGEAYKEAILDLIDKNLIDLDMLKEQLSSIPGAQLFANVFQEMDCPPFPLFTPPLGNILTTLELGLCPAKFAISLPKFSLDIAIGDIFKLLIDVAIELFKDLVVKIIIMTLKKILEIIFEAACALLQLVGTAVADAFSGGNALKDALGGALCDDASEEDINEAMGKVIAATGLGHCSGPEDVPTVEDAEAFTEIVASVLTNQEVLDLLDGSATTQVKQMISDVVSEQVSSLSCVGPSDIGSMFKALGSVLNPELFENAQIMEDVNSPVCESICASPEQLEMFNDLRCTLMQEKGLKPEDCEEQINSLRDRAKEDLADLAKILNGGPFHNFPDLIGSDPICPDTNDPFGPGKSILPSVPQALNDAASNAAKKVFERIAEEHIDDLVGRRGFLDMVLSDSNGRGLKSHENTVNGPFGEPLTDDLGIFQSYTDNWMDDKGSNTALPEGFPSEQGRGSAGDWGFIINHVGTGGFPITVASLLQYYFASYNESITFNLPVDTTESSAGPAYPMRGTSISFDSSNYNVSPFVRGVPWEDSNLDLKYRDYVKNDNDSYAMRMNISAAYQQEPATSIWSDKDITLTEIYENFENAGEELTTSLLVESNISDKAQEIIDTLDTSSNTPLPKKLFSQLLISKLKSYGITVDADGYDTFPALKEILESQHEYLCDVYMRKFSLLMSSNNSGKIDPIPNSFQFGYDTSQQLQTVYMAGEDLDEGFYEANSEYYQGVDNYSDAKSTESAQQEILDRFGGTYKNPPYYMKNPERYGWLGMTDSLVPDPDACDPIDGSEPREPICKFDDLKDVYADLINKYQDDKRLTMRPGSSCSDPQPFNAIFNKGGSAGVDSVILAMIRIYVVEVMLRGTAIFSIFGSECYDEILPAYIIKYIDEELNKMGTWGLPSKKFYYYFMEQVVQMYGRQIDLGMITPTDGEQDALNNLNEFQMKNQIRATGKVAYTNKLGEIVQDALDKEESGEWVSGIRTLLSHFVAKEIKTIFTQFGDNLYPDGAPISNVQSIFFNSPAFIRGSIQSGIPDVWNGLEGSESNVYEADLLSSYAGVIDGTSVYPYLASRPGNAGIGNHPFRLEKYISFEESPEDIPEHLKGIVSIEEFNNWASGQTGLLSTAMSELFSGAKLGFRLVFATSASDRGDSEWGGDENTEPLRSELSGLLTSSDTALFEKTLYVPVNQEQYSTDVLSLYAPTRTHMYMIPISSAEMELDLGQTLQEFIDSIDETALSNQECLLDEIANSGEFQVMFDNSIPFRKMLSWLAIYNINNFLPSVGWVQDGWTMDGGKWIGIDAGFRTWDQKSFEKSKRATKRAFMRFYNSSDPTYEDEESKGRKDEITRRKKPKSNNNPGWRWFKWRRKIRKPTDKNEKLCL